MSSRARGSKSLNSPRNFAAGTRRNIRYAFFHFFFTLYDCIAKCSEKSVREIDSEKEKNEERERERKRREREREYRKENDDEAGKKELVRQAGSCG